MNITRSQIYVLSDYRIKQMKLGDLCAEVKAGNSLSFDGNNVAVFTDEREANIELARRIAIRNIGYVLLKSSFEITQIEDLSDILFNISQYDKTADWIAASRKWLNRVTQDGPSGTLIDQLGNP